MSQVQTLSGDVRNFISDNMLRWAEGTIQAEAIRFARAANMPPKFIDGIKIIQKGDKIFLENEWKSKDTDAPLAVFFEYGTSDHWVAPLSPDGVLAWTSKGTTNTRNASAIYFKNFSEKKGDKMFSKGHYVSGLPRLEPMTRGYQAGLKRFRYKIQTEVKRKFSKENPSYKIRVKA